MHSESKKLKAIYRKKYSTREAILGEKWVAECDHDGMPLLDKEGKQFFTLRTNVRIGWTPRKWAKDRPSFKQWVRGQAESGSIDSEPAQKYLHRKATLSRPTPTRKRKPAKVAKAAKVDKKTKAASKAASKVLGKFTTNVK